MTDAAVVDDLWGAVASALADSATVVAEFENGSLILRCKPLAAHASAAEPAVVLELFEETTGDYELANDALRKVAQLNLGRLAAEAWRSRRNLPFESDIRGCTVAVTSGIIGL